MEAAIRRHDHDQGSQAKVMEAVQLGAKGMYATIYSRTDKRESLGLFEVKRRVVIRVHAVSRRF